MTAALYILWFLIPAFFFLLALWAKLEQLGGSVKKQNPKDFFQQGFFVLVCVLICVVIDRYILADLVNNFAPEIMTLGFFQAILLPAVLLIGAKIIGPTQEILIGSKNRKGAHGTHLRRR